ncbi:MAG: hypothetical protein K9M56_04450 [Victivallales bacterium]|nr:hypothetical protein [Victivallales bacterium]
MPFLNFFKKLNSFVPYFIRHNFLRKVIAVFFAILVYLKVSTEIGEEKIIQGVPVNFITHGNIEIMTYKPKTVNLTVRTSKKSINLLTASKFRVDINISEDILEKYKNSEYSHINIDFSKEQVHAPTDVHVLSVNPSDLTVQCDKNISKKVKVEPRFEGSLPQDYKYGEVSLTPKHITLTGPESIIKEIKTVNTKPISLGPSTVASFQVDKKLQQVAPKIIATPSSVQVKVEIYKALTTRVFKNIPVHIMSASSIQNFLPKLLTRAVDITLHGPKSHLELLTRNKIKAFIDISNYNKLGIYESKVEVWCKDITLNIKFVEPSYIKVELNQFKIKGETT